MTEDREVIAEHLFETGADNPIAQPQTGMNWKPPQKMWNGTWNFIVNLILPKKYNSNPVHSEVLRSYEYSKTM